MTRDPIARAHVPQLRTILLTDLCDSTQLVERLGDAAAAELFREHDRLVLQLQQRWHGRLIDRSDGLLLLFERPIDGLGFALDYARGLRGLGAPHGVELKARAGLHVGEVLTWRNSEEAVRVGAKPLEVEGLAKPMAGRLMAMARPGQILVSAIAEPLAHRAARELGERGQHLLWKSYGRWRLKGLPHPQEVFEVGEAGIAPLRAPRPSPKAWRDIPLWRRPAALLAQAALLAGLAVGVWFVTRPQPAIAFQERDWVVVADLRNLTGQTLLDDSLEQAFRISLEQSRYVNVLSDMKARQTLERMRLPADTALDRAIASEIALRDGARAVILPTVAEVGGRVRVSAEVIDPNSQTTVYSEHADGKGAPSALASIDEVTAGLRERLGEELDAIKRDSTPLPQVTTSSLDALRAYALAQQSYGESHYQQARQFYERATELDPEFALAYVGLVKAHNGLGDLAGGISSLRKAKVLKDRLTPRDQLYLEAWSAQVDAPDDAVGKWRQMAALYPDFFPAWANVGNAMYMKFQYAEGVPFAKRATSARNAFTYLSWDLLGRLYLGQDQYELAEKAFAQALSGGMESSKVRLAATHAAQQDFKQALQVWPPATKLENVYFERASIYVDMGRWEDATSEVRGFSQATEPGSWRARMAALPAATMQWVEGDRASTLVRLGEAVDMHLGSLRPDNRMEALEDAYAAVMAGLLAQRLDDGLIARQVLAGLEKHRQLLNFEPLETLVLVLKANDARLAGKPDQAIAMLGPRVTGREPLQLHGVLLAAYRDAGRREDALGEATLIATRRGRAYTENACGWCAQPLNVLDTTLAHLQAAQILIELGRSAEARSQLKEFDRRWSRNDLPGYLRKRRDAVDPRFN